jgi:hypothetical protein
LPVTRKNERAINMKEIHVTILSMIVVFASCKDMGSEPPPIPPPPPLPEDVALYVSMDSYADCGICILNANSLQRVDSLVTRPGVPWTIEFSPNYSVWYSIWATSGSNHSLFSGEVRPLSVRQVVPLQDSKYALVKSADERYLIAFGNKGIEVYDRSTLSLFHRDTSSVFNSQSPIRSSQSNNRIYFVWIENRQPIGVASYDLDSLRLLDTLRLFDDARYPGLRDVDLVVSPDDTFLFLSAWNWRGFGGFNSFFVIDLCQRRLVAEYRCGPFARLAVSPNGRSVYISRAGFTLYILPPNNHRTYRYDVLSNTMHDFLSRGGSTGIVVADDNRTVFLSDASEIIKVDALTGTTLGTYSVPLDSLGRLTSLIRNIRLGKYPSGTRHK